ncbi:SCO7613 C-terminal domain-containing membrane protein [Nocardioides aquiterrae]|uniref:DUF2157 domain-containing protein n=1 Tax=Nocardioides aquiterrae TaxID=203799 RepID=A0ABP4FCF0_9ACTN
MSTLSVPKILLGLGALCLLVAAVAFLVATWSSLGIGGRTAVLTGLTVVTGGLGAWLGRRELRVAGEALTTVGLGLLALDVVGADRAGWLGHLTIDELVAVLGAAVLAAGLGLALVTRLGAPQVIGILGLSALGGGVLTATGHATLVPTAVVLAHAGLAAVARVRRLAPLLLVAAAGASYWWLDLLLTGLDRAAERPSLHALWAEGRGAALLVAALLPLLVIPFVRRYAGGDRYAVAATATLLTVTAALPAVDEGATAVGVVGLGVLVAWTLAASAVPTGWRVVAWPSMVVAALPVAGIVVTLVGQALANAVGTETPFGQPVTARLGDPDPAAAPLLLLLGVAGLVAALLAVLPELPRWQLPAGVLALAALATLALHPVPVWTLGAGLAVLGAALAAESLRHEGAFGLIQSVAGVAVVVVGLIVALPSDVLTAAVLGVLVATAAALHRWGWVDQQVWGGLLLPVSAAGLLWVVCEVAGVDVSLRGVPVLVLVGLLAIARPRPEIEASAAVAALAAASAAVDGHPSLAVHLTVAGALVSVSALVHPGRRPLGWLGGALLVAATWVRLWDVGVTAPEPYTLPTAVALVLVGLVHLRRHPGSPTGPALGPGILLATVPSLLWVLDDPLGPRAVLLGLGCLALVVAGAQLRWNAPLLVGAAVGATVVLRELAPYAAEVPQWALIGSAGTLLTVVGVTWERRLRDLRAAGSYLGRLR